MIKLVINILLAACAIALGYWLYEIIQEPIRFQEEKDKREDAVRTQLKNIAQLQDLYETVNGKYAWSFNELVRSMNSDSLEIERIEVDSVDEYGVPYGDTIKMLLPLADSVQQMGIDLSGLDKVPFSAAEGEEQKYFEFMVDSLMDQNVMVHTFEVSTLVKYYMTGYTDEKYKRFDKTYDIYSMRKVGDLTKQTSAGNW